MMRYFAGCLAMAAILGFAIFMAPDIAEEPKETEITKPPTIAQKVELEKPSVQEVPQKTIKVLQDGQVVEMEESTYLEGVVYGEMPASFQLEALKAQAVAARTFLARQQEHPKHDNADICTNSACCQAYQKVPEEWQEVIHQAVAETAGEVLTYEGQLIEAVYFSCSGGQTEGAVAVWGGDVPYLQSVDSPGEEISQKFRQETVIPQDTWKSVLLEKCPGISLGSLPDLWVGTYIYTAGGGVDKVNIGGKWIAGVDLRSWFGLPSTDFSISVENQDVVVTTLGYGHRVGMSQYGAQVMALEGCGYEEILKHYYTGVELTTMPLQQ